MLSQPRQISQGRSSGVCKLTGQHGLYVKSHIIPAPLTRLPTNGKKIVEAGIGRGVKSRFVSWYDNELVTRVGEDILEEIDTSAIEVLREHKLVWSSWGAENELKTDDLLTSTGESALRLVQIQRAKELHIFFLSLLWRSAASSRPEFSDVKLPADTVEDLRQRVLLKDPGAFSDFPVQLFQIISKGTLHNRTPLLERTVVQLEPGETWEIEYVRFYFDGLVARVHTSRDANVDDRYLGTCLRSDERTIVFTHPFDASRAAADIKEMVSTVTKETTTLNSQLNSIAKAVRDCWET